MYWNHNIHPKQNQLILENKSMINKFRKNGLTLIRAGGDAGLFSAIIPGWLMKGETGTEPITKEI